MNANSALGAGGRRFESGHPDCSGAYSVGGKSSLGSLSGRPRCARGMCQRKPSAVVGAVAMPSTSTIAGSADPEYHRHCPGRWRGAISRIEGGQRVRRKVSGRTKSEVKDRLKALHEELDQGVKPSASHKVADALTRIRPGSPCPGRRQRRVRDVRALAIPACVAAAPTSWYSSSVRPNRTLCTRPGICRAVSLSACPPGGGGQAGLLLTWCGGQAYRWSPAVH